MITAEREQFRREVAERLRIFRLSASRRAWARLTTRNNRKICGGGRPKPARYAG